MVSFPKRGLIYTFPKDSTTMDGKDVPKYLQRCMILGHDQI